MMFDVLTINTRELLIGISSLVAVVLGWYLGVNTGINIIKPAWLREGFLGKYFPSLPSDNKWSEEIIEEIISGVSFVILLFVSGYAVVRALVLFESTSLFLIYSTRSVVEILPGGIERLLSVVLFKIERFIKWDSDILFVIMPLSMFTKVFLASIVNIVVLNLRFEIRPVHK